MRQLSRDLSDEEFSKIDVDMMTPQTRGSVNLNRLNTHVYFVDSLEP